MSNTEDTARQSVVDAARRLVEARPLMGEPVNLIYPRFEPLISALADALDELDSRAQ